jgi:hypothetical protein
VAADVTGWVALASPYLQIEYWADAERELIGVPILGWQVSLFIHRRKLAIYR